MTEPRILGDTHVKEVYKLLSRSLNGEATDGAITLAEHTARYISVRFPEYVAIKTKFDFSDPDKHSDIILILDNNKQININLFLIKNNRKIQLKNPGIRSFLKKYFLSNDLQMRFNQKYDQLYEDFLNTVLDVKGMRFISHSVKEMKKEVSELYPEFVPEIEMARAQFLYLTRELCFELLTQDYNQGARGITNAIETIVMTDSINIVTRYKSDNVLKSIEEFNPCIGDFEQFKIIKKGNYSIGFAIDSITLLIRFKFESGPSSSIKLATSFDDPITEDVVVLENKNSQLKFKSEVTKHRNAIVSKLDSNAVGKCCEAIVYSEVLSCISDVKQIDPNLYIDLFEKYSTKVPFSIIESLIMTANKAVLGLLAYLNNKYVNLKIESVDLVPDIYIKDKKNSADLILIIRSNLQYFSEPVSLKALKKDTGVVIAKNPGLGTIFSPDFFDLESMIDLAAESKAIYNSQMMSRRLALEKIAFFMGNRLSCASNEILASGINALLGDATVLVLFYNELKYKIIRHLEVNTDITVIKNYPTSIQNTLTWDGGSKQLLLRVKFGKGESHGWSALKLAVSYKYGDTSNDKKRIFMSEARL